MPVRMSPIVTKSVLDFLKERAKEYEAYFWGDSKYKIRSRKKKHL
jgi:hypothetical protein